MLSTKTRNTIIALVASASFAGASLAPAVSQARTKGPPAGRCAAILNLGALGLELASKALAAGEYDRATRLFEDAEETFLEYTAIGCGAAPTQSSTRGTIVAPAGPLKETPPHSITPRPFLGNGLLQALPDAGRGPRTPDSWTVIPLL
jgi:hypothetical protein